MIDEDGFHFGTAMDTEGAEWEHTLSFSEITASSPDRNSNVYSKDGGDTSRRAASCLAP